MRPVEPTSKVGGFEKGQTQTVGNFFAETPDLAFLEASQTPGATLHIFGWEIVLFAALLFLVDFDAELGDQHSDRLRRGSYGVSLYVNLDTQRGGHIRVSKTEFQVCARVGCHSPGHVQGASAGHANMRTRKV
jgi:hypothetical protein